MVRHGRVRGVSDDSSRGQERQEEAEPRPTRRAREEAGAARIHADAGDVGAPCERGKKGLAILILLSE
jgi:hypothetical protein